MGIVSNAWYFNNGVQSTNNKNNQYGWAPVVEFYVKIK